jgi:hypothetical protein
MGAIEIIIKVFLALVAVAFVGYPFLRQMREEAPAVTPEHELLLERKAQVDAALQEVEFDYRTGKLPDRDFHDLTARFLREQVEVASLLGLPDAAEVDGAGPLAPESAVSAGAIAVPVVAGTLRGACPSCETLNPTGVKFCGACGGPLNAGSRSGRKAQGQRAIPTCAACGAELRAGNKFCGSCGAKT